MKRFFVTAIILSFLFSICNTALAKLTVAGPDEMLKSSELVIVGNIVKRNYTKDDRQVQIKIENILKGEFKGKNIILKRTVGKMYGWLGFNFPKVGTKVFVLLRTDRNPNTYNLIFDLNGVATVEKNGNIKLYEGAKINNLPVRHYEEKFTSFYKKYLTKFKKVEIRPAENIKVVRKLEHGLLGYGKTQTIVLSVIEDTYEAPFSWSITVDGQKKLDLGRDNYDTADIKFKDIDGDKHDEILIYRGSGGSAGAGGLNIYKPSTSKWKELFAVKKSFDLPSKRFRMKYIGNYRVSFENLETELKATIPLEKNRYKGMENSLPKISSWVDPISDYELKDIDGDGVMEITTMQRVIGVAHADNIGLFKTRYKMHNQKYRADRVFLYDDKGHLLAQAILQSY